MHGLVLRGTKALVNTCVKDGDSSIQENEVGGTSSSYWKNVVAPQRLLVVSSEAIGGPATVIVLANISLGIIIDADPTGW